MPRLGCLIVVLLLLAAGAGLYFYHQPLMAFSNAYLLEQDAHRYIAAGNFEGAAQAYEQGLALTPNDKKRTLALAQLYHRLGRTDDAETLYRKTLALDSKNYEARLGYAVLLTQADQYNHAVDQLRAALGMYGHNTVVLNTLGNLYRKASENPAESRGQTRRWLQDWAIYYYRLALKQDPANYDSHFQLALLYQAQEEFDRAARHYCQAIAAWPSSYEVHYNLGLTLVELGHFDPGVRQLNTAVQLLRKQERMADAQSLAESAQGVKNSILEGTPTQLPLPVGVTTDCLSADNLELGNAD